MNVLVAGGAGYIGSVTVGQLLDAGHRVVVLDNLSKGHRVAVPGGAEFVQADLGDSDTVKGLCAARGIDVAMHFAAFTAVGESVARPEQYFENNSVKTKHLLDALLEGGVRQFVFSSTAAVYGEPIEIPIPETHPRQPTSPYGWSKLFVEELLKAYAEPHGLRSIAFRYFNAAGATANHGEDHQPETHLIPLILQTVLGLRPALQVFGNDYPTPDGTCIRDYIHVLDLADAHVRAVEALNDGHPGGAYNLGNGEGYSVAEVVETASKVTGKEIPTVHAPRRPGDPARLVASSELARRTFGWEPHIPELDRIVRSTWDWMQKHPKGYSEE